jgi:tetratricopeptide (TPR) repeat protein
MDACSLLREVHWRKGDVPLYLAYTARLCSLHLAARESQAAWQDYEEFLQHGGDKLPAQTWLDLCRVPEDQGAFERALEEYQKLAAAYPAERQSLMALLAAARICLKRLDRPQDAMKFYALVAKSPLPHLDLEPNIQTGMREARAALAAPGVPAEASS